MIKLYQKVFSEPPWNEYRMCKNCKVNYGRGEIIRKTNYDENVCGIIKIEFEYPKNGKCKNCSIDLSPIEPPVRTFSSLGSLRTNPNLTEFWSYSRILEDIRDGQKQTNPIFLVAENNRSIVGFTWAYKIPIGKFPFLQSVLTTSAAYIDELAVRKKFRRKGIASALTNSLIKEADKLGFDEVVLRTDTNGVAYRFYLDLGFEDMNIRGLCYSERTYMKKLIK